MRRSKHGLIDTDAYSSRLRERAVDVSGGRLLITNFLQTEQEKDLTEPPNCNGFGRIRHFSRKTVEGWPCNPLPIDPASKALGLSQVETLRAQVFQNAACNWRCWYCFVPFELLSANQRYSDWMTPAALIDLYLDQINPPPMIDLTGGQPLMECPPCQSVLQDIEAIILAAAALKSDDTIDYPGENVIWERISMIKKSPTDEVKEFLLSWDCLRSKIIAWGVICPDSAPLPTSPQSSVLCFSGRTC